MKSQDKLNTCDTDLIRLFNEAINHRDIKIICGRRGRVAQNKAYNGGFSTVKYPQSYHNRTPSKAVDATPCPLNWKAIDDFKDLGNFILGLAAGMEIEIEWGGNWDNFPDFAHYQLKG
ncbi:MAG: M15 family metallopeptidase [candidate division Zixibacteria bacterium]|nr:M15 family metallopeptidase [candidate division Zixibacteria bacterium]